MNYSHSVVCTECLRTMQPEKIGIVVLEKDYKNEPYLLYNADLYACPGCHRQAITGFGNHPTHVATLAPAKRQERLAKVDYVIGD